MQIENLALSGIKLITPKVFADDRGFFLEPWNASRFRALGLETDFVQDNHSRSSKHTIRGLHMQLAKGAVPGQAKLIRCARGSILDVVVDARPWSKTFKQHLAVQLDDVKHQQLYIPVGFAHGFCVLSDIADVCYKVTSLYDPSTETGFRFDDPDVGIQWPVASADAIVSARDRTAPTLNDLLPRLRGLAP
jgi:dTDP-4-dehydrorhamnose 3,5-epimerase